MIKQNDSLIKLKLNNEFSFLIKFKKKIYEPLYLLFGLILENPIENFWLESFSIIIGYFQLIFYIFDKTVRKIELNIN